MALPGSPLVGRARELDLLTRLLDQAAAGEGGLALLVGEPGIGKSRLLEEAAAAAASRGFAVAFGRAWELGSAPTYWPWIEVLRALLARPGGRDDRSAALLELLPELGARGSSVRQAARSEALGAFALCDAVGAYLLAQSEREPVLIVLDDLHAADPSSLQLAELVARSLRGARLCLFGSHRDLEARRSPEIEATLARLSRAGEVLLLPRLSAAEVETWVREQTGRADAVAARMIHDASEGNPLFVRELLRLIEARGASGSSGVPAGVRAVIRERLSLLSPATVALLQAAAVLGREFSLQLAADVAGVTPAALDEAAAETRAADLLGDARPGRLRFSHALVAETLAADLPVAMRTRLHRRAAEILERRRGEDPASVSLDEIAHHFLGAGSELASSAVVASERAAVAAMERLAFADAAAHYARALGALSLSAPADALRRAEMLIAEAEADSRAGQRSAALTASTEAAEIAAAAGDGVLLARAALAFGAESFVGEAVPPLIRLLERALESLPPGDDPWRAKAMARLASARQPQADPRPQVELAREAIAMARRLGDPQVLMHVLHSALGALVDYAPPSERAAYNRETADLAAQLSDRPRELWALMRLMFDCVELADIAGLEAALQRYETRAAGLDQPRYQWVPLMIRSMRANWEGRFADADRLESEARELYERVRGEGPPLAPARGLSTALLKHDTDAVRREVRAFVAIFPAERAAAAFFEVLALAREGRAAEARDLLTAVRTQHPERMRADVHVVELLSEIAFLLRDAAIAQLAYAPLAELEGRMFVITGIAFGVHALVDHARMQVCSALGELDEAEGHARSALELCARLSARPIAARIQHDYAQLLVARGGESRLAMARALLREACETSAALVMSELHEQCRTLRAKIEPAPTASEPASEPTKAAASASEPARAVELVLEGEYWTVRGFGELCRVRDSRGMRMLAQLLEQPGRELHVLDLSGALDPVDGGDGGEVLDQQARTAYLERARELQSELQQAETWNDTGRRERLQDELDALRAELSRATRLSGKARRSGSAVERARVNVRRRLTLALDHVSKVSPAIGRHLRARLRTGVYCGYEG